MIPEGIGRYQPAARRILQPIVRRLWDFDVEGLHHVPNQGPAVLCPNHAAFIDSLFVPAVLTRNLTYVGKAEYLDDWKTRHLFPALGMIPIDRRGGDHAKAALDTARGVLQSGGLFGIYPEGTRSRSGKLHKGHTGAARLAVETGAPLVPVGLIGTAEIQPPDTFMPRFGGRVGIRFGRPIQVDRYRSGRENGSLFRELIDEVMYEIQQLTGLDYVHEYAGSKKTTAAEDPAARDPRLDRPEPVPANRAEPPTDADEVLIERPLADAVLEQRPLRPLDEILAGSASG